VLLQILKPRFDIGGGQLETVTRHVAVGAGSAIALKPVQPSVNKVKQAAEDDNTAFTATIDVF